MQPFDITTGSPARKKLRLSPENVVQYSSQEQPNALDNSFAQPKPGFSKATTLLSTAPGIGDDPDNPFTDQSSRFTKASSVLPSLGFASASSVKIDIQSRELSASPDMPAEHDCVSWFNSADVRTPLAGFQTAGFASTTTSQLSGFVSVRSNSSFAPSAAALAKAQAQLRDIWDESLGEFENPITNPKDQFASPAPKHTQPTLHRPALQALDNGPQTPGTPTPTGFSRPPGPGKSQAVEQLKAKQKPFRSPLLKSISKPESPNPNFNSSIAFTSAASMSSQRATFSTKPSTPFKPTLPKPKPQNFQTPARASANTSTRAPFITPFKPGMRPGEPGWVKLQGSKKKGGSQLTTCSPAVSSLTHEAVSSQSSAGQYRCLFDLRPPPNRRTLAESGMRPRRFDEEDLESMDINAQELRQITPSLAIFYSFHTTSTLPPSQIDQPAQLLGPAAALKELHDMGCTLATKAWIDNHWSLVLWKLAGMVALDPDSESNQITKRWCWTEVKRQLLYRYERELNQAKRPPLRLITAQDAPAALPLALCVSNIFWAEPEDQLSVTYPELEVTDGWYRLRAKIDAPMIRAVKKGVIRVGRKIGVAAARLDSERKEPQEILDAYGSVKLIISGNSSHLLSWDTKLGFMKGPCISTMHSLTPDGGSIAAMDVVVVKVHALAFIEFTVDPYGRKRREGPRGETEEMKINDEWKKKRDNEASKIRMIFEKKVSRYESYIGKLERLAGSSFHPHQDDEPPDHIEKLYNQLEEHEDAMRVLSKIHAQDAGWLAKHTRRSLDMECERTEEEIAKELEVVCPPREVRSFRVIVVEDSRTCRRPPHRHAQLTVWDILSLTFFEGAKPGDIEIGSRFLITNLIPQQQGAWMGTRPNSQIFLATTRASRWQKLKAST